MRSSLKVLVTVPWLLMATVSMAQGSQKTPPPAQPAPSASGSSKQTILFVEIIQLNAQTQTFRATLVDVRSQKVILERTGKGAELQIFQKESAEKAPRTQTVSLMGPGDPVTSDSTTRPPRPPGPPGDELLRLVNQVARSYDAIQPAQFQISPNALPPVKLKSLPPEAQPSTVPANPAVRQ